MSTPDQSQPSGPDQHMPALAAEFVQTCKGAGINLDFQLRTLPFVDKYLAGVRLESQQLAAAKDPEVRRSSPGVRRGSAPTSAK